MYTSHQHIIIPQPYTKYLSRVNSYTMQRVTSLIIPSVPLRECFNSIIMHSTSPSLEHIRNISLVLKQVSYSGHRVRSYYQ